MPKEMAEIEVFYALDHPIDTRADDGYYDAPILGIVFGYNRSAHLLSNGTREQLQTRLAELIRALPPGVTTVTAHNCVDAAETPDGWVTGMAEALREAHGAYVKHWDGRRGES